ncbi:MAG: hypothetical protein ABI778_12325, partial [Ignavibacteriota bacterium]
MRTVVNLCHQVQSALWIIVFLVVVGCTTSGFAQVPRTMNYQGVISDPSGHPIADGQHVLSISLYDIQDPSTPIFNEVDRVETLHGLFSVVLGSQTPIPFSIQFDKQYSLGIAVDGTPEMSPRTLLTTAPYAMRAQVAEMANGLAPNASGLVTSINEVSGHLYIQGDSTLTVTSANKVISLHANAITS